jgi:hypothetical protein
VPRPLNAALERMKTIVRQLAFCLASMAGATGCAAIPEVLSPSCNQPAPLDGRHDPRAPGYIVQLVDDVADVHSFVHQIAEKYSFTPSAVYETAIKGFAVKTMKPEALASLRCEPKVRGISFNEQTTIAGRAL